MLSVCFWYFEAQSQYGQFCFAEWPFLAPFKNGAIFGVWGVFPGCFLAWCNSNVVLAFFVFDLHRAFVLICFAMYTKKKWQRFYRWHGHQVVADLFFVFVFNKCAWKNPMVASTYNMEIKITWIIVLNLRLSVLEKHMRSC